MRYGYMKVIWFLYLNAAAINSAAATAIPIQGNSRNIDAADKFKRFLPCGIFANLMGKFQEGEDGHGSVSSYGSSDYESDGDSSDDDDYYNDGDNYHVKPTPVMAPGYITSTISTTYTSSGTVVTHDGSVYRDVFTTVIPILSSDDRQSIENRDSLTLAPVALSVATSDSYEEPLATLASSTSSTAVSATLETLEKEPDVTSSSSMYSELSPWDESTSAAMVSATATSLTVDQPALSTIYVTYPRPALQPTGGEIGEVMNMADNWVEYNAVPSDRAVKNIFARPAVASISSNELEQQYNELGTKIWPIPPPIATPDHFGSENVSKGPSMTPKAREPPSQTAQEGLVSHAHENIINDDWDDEDDDSDCSDDEYNDGECDDEDEDDECCDYECSDEDDDDCEDDDYDAAEWTIPRGVSNDDAKVSMQEGQSFPLAPPIGPSEGTPYTEEDQQDGRNGADVLVTIVPIATTTSNPLSVHSPTGTSITPLSDANYPENRVSVIIGVPSPKPSISYVPLPLPLGEGQSSAAVLPTPTETLAPEVPGIKEIPPIEQPPAPVIPEIEEFPPIEQPPIPVVPEIEELPPVEQPPAQEIPDIPTSVIQVPTPELPRFTPVIQTPIPMIPDVTPVFQPPPPNVPEISPIIQPPGPQCPDVPEVPDVPVTPEAPEIAPVIRPPMPLDEGVPDGGAPEMQPAITPDYRPLERRMAQDRSLGELDIPSHYDDYFGHHPAPFPFDDDEFGDWDRFDGPRHHPNIDKEEYEDECDHHHDHSGNCNECSSSTCCTGHSTHATETKSVLHTTTVATVISLPTPTATETRHVTSTRALLSKTTHTETRHLTSTKSVLSRTAHTETSKTTHTRTSKTTHTRTSKTTHTETKTRPVTKTQPPVTITAVSPSTRTAVIPLTSAHTVTETTTSHIKTTHLSISILHDTKASLETSTVREISTLQIPAVISAQTLTISAATAVPPLTTLTGATLEPHPTFLTGVTLDPSLTWLTGATLEPKPTMLTGVTLDPSPIWLTGATLEPQPTFLTGVTLDPSLTVLTGATLEAVPPLATSEVPSPLQPLTILTGATLGSAPTPNPPPVPVTNVLPVPTISNYIPPPPPPPPLVVTTKPPAFIATDETTNSLLDGSPESVDQKNLGLLLENEDDIGDTLPFGRGLGVKEYDESETQSAATSSELWKRDMGSSENTMSGAASPAAEDQVDVDVADFYGLEVHRVGDTEEYGVQINGKPVANQVQRPLLDIEDASATISAESDDPYSTGATIRPAETTSDSGDDSDIANVDENTGSTSTIDPAADMSRPSTAILNGDGCVCDCGDDNHDPSKGSSDDGDDYDCDDSNDDCSDDCSDDDSNDDCNDEGSNNDCDDDGSYDDCEDDNDNGPGDKDDPSCDGEDGGQADNDSGDDCGCTRTVERTKTITKQHIRTRAEPTIEPPIITLPPWRLTRQPTLPKKIPPVLDSPDDSPVSASAYLTTVESLPTSSVSEELTSTIYITDTQVVTRHGRPVPATTIAVKEQSP